ncbi:MAG: tRNA pseudouridine(38-40) synthase TruA [Alphaproteobacteria bacterium]|nr:MAG: tRNA pseudouridine(38-40) synthase TruA [Alphaproteobacteria bacterium]
MTKYKAIVEYSGAPYAGWQLQEGHPTVQGVIEAAIEKFCGEPAIVRAAGRTDSGVHALGQVIDFTIDKPVKLDAVRDGVNYHLKPNPVALVTVEEVDKEFSSRFDATQRHYLYRVLDRRAPPTVTRGLVAHTTKALDVDAMHHAAQVLVGNHDFTTFRSSSCQSKSPVKTVNKISVSRVGDEVHINVSARSFLHNQVRSFAGTLLKVGEGKWTRRDVEKALQAKDRTACGPTAPPEGLYLTRVDYGADR